MPAQALRCAKAPAAVEVPAPLIQEEIEQVRLPMIQGNVKVRPKVIVKVPAPMIQEGSQQVRLPMIQEETMLVRLEGTVEVPGPRSR